MKRKMNTFQLKTASIRETLAKHVSDSNNFKSSRFFGTWSNNSTFEYACYLFW